MNAYTEIHNFYAGTLVPRLREKTAHGEKIRVGFMVLYSSVFPAQSLFEAMLESDVFEPFIVITPDVGRQNRIPEQCRKTAKDLARKYKDLIRMGYDVTNGTPLDYSDDMDMVYFGTPYAESLHPKHKIEYFVNKGVLPFHTHFTYFGIITHERDIIQSSSYNMFWKVFVESDTVMSLLKKYQPLRGENAVISGFCRMDPLVEHVREPHSRKRVILAPSHPVTNDMPGVPYCHFLDYAELFLCLPERYPQIDFIFRPHPFVLQELKDKVWGEEKTNIYMERLTAHPNLTHDTNPTYLQQFVDSDALIHDGCSFLAGYFFTDNPQCYMLPENRNLKDIFDVVGLECLGMVYKAYSEKGITDFLDSVVLGGRDDMREVRQAFLKNNLMRNHPYVGKSILRHMEEAFSGI